MGFIVEVEFPVEELALCKMQGNIDSDSLITLFENIVHLHKGGALYFILEGKKLKTFSKQAFSEFASAIEKYFSKCTFVFCGINVEIQKKLGDDINRFSFFSSEKGCLDFFAKHLGMNIAAEDEQTVEKCGAATIAMEIPERLREIVLEEEKKNKK